MSRVIVSSCVAVLVGACTYNEYNNTYIQLADAGAQGARGGSGGAGGGSPDGGSSSTAPGGASGAGGETYCTGCLLLAMPATPARALALAFDDDQDLSDTQLSWRVRLRNFSDSVSLTLYAESGSDENERLFIGSFELTAAAGWQTFGADFTNLDSFRPPTFLDAGEGAGGSGFDEGFPFDKSQVERLIAVFGTSQPPGVFTPLLIEIDEVRFSDQSALDRDFQFNAGGVELVSVDGSPIEGATLAHLNE